VLFAGLGEVVRSLSPDVLYIDTEPENYAAAQCRYVIDRYSPHTHLALVSSRNLDYRLIGFPYKLPFTHTWCDNLVRRRRAEIVFVRPRTTMHLLQEYGRRVVYLPHSVDCDLFSPDVPATRPARQDEFVVGYVGRLVESKGVHVLVRAMRNLPGNVHALIVGQGPERGPLEASARTLGVAGRITFMPAAPYAAVPGIIRSLDILVLPSLVTSHWVEQFGRVLIEAMACGTPVVASRTGEIPEVLGGGGVVCAPDDEQTLATVISELSRNPSKCSELASTGRTRALEGFSAPIVAQMMYSAFKACL
jgi:glycosyltransferase involved in cell wall biosynthesis